MQRHQTGFYMWYPWQFSGRMLLPGAPGTMGTGSHRCSMAPVFDFQHAVVTSREGAEQFLWKMPGNNRRPKNTLLWLQPSPAFWPVRRRLFFPVSQQGWGYPEQSRSEFVTLPAGHKLLLWKCVCVCACGCTLLKDWFKEEMQLVWPTSSAGFSHISSFWPSPSCIPFKNPIGSRLLWATLSTHLTSGANFCIRLVAFFLSLLSGLFCQVILRQFPTWACELPLSLVWGVHAAEYLRSQGGWEES